MSVRDMRIREMNTIVAGTPVDKIAGLLTEPCITGLPLLDGENRAIGFLIRGHLVLQEKGMPFSFFRFPRLLRCWVDSIQLMAQRTIKRVPGLHKDWQVTGKT